MKGLGSPPWGVYLTSRVVMILLGEKVTLSDPDEKVWKKSVQLMNNPPQFLERLKAFKGEDIEQNILDQVNKVISDPTKKYTYNDMTSQSVAASYMCKWSIAIVKFNDIFKKVKPI